MKKINFLFAGFFAFVLFATVACKSEEKKACCHAEEGHGEFEYFAESFADLKILRYQVPGFDDLDLKKKELLYCLGQAALAGRDMIWDQNYRYNLTVRHTLEAIINNYAGDQNLRIGRTLWFILKEFGSLVVFTIIILKIKILPDFSYEYFNTLLDVTDEDKLPALRKPS